MKIFVSLLVMVLCAGFVNAELLNFDNPFPAETNSYGLNNIYEISPEAISKEKRTNEKIKNSKWWNRQESAKTEDINNSSVNEGINHSFYQRGVRAEDSGFVIFK